MSERGFSLVEAIVSLGVMGIVLASAMGVVAALPRQASRWEDAADARQRLRVVDARGARLAVNAGPIGVRVGAATIHVPSLWPRRLGLIDAGAPGDVSQGVITFVSRADGHRALVLDEPLGPSGGAVAARGSPGCGTAPACGVSTGDILMAVSAASDVGLFRVSGVHARLGLEALMPGVPFQAGSVLVPVALASMTFDAGELRLYDGYRSDGIVVDGLAGFAMTFEPAALRLDDGPWTGTGPLAFDADQLLLRGAAGEVALVARDGLPAQRALLVWGVR